MCVRARKGDFCDTDICVCMPLCLCDRDGEKGDLGAGEDTGVLEMEGAWEKAEKEEERKEQRCGEYLTFEHPKTPLK